MSIWTQIKKFASQLGFTYNQAGKTYNEATINYNGKATTVWSNRAKN